MSGHSRLTSRSRPEPCSLNGAAGPPSPYHIMRIGVAAGVICLDFTGEGPRPYLLYLETSLPDEQFVVGCFNLREGRLSAWLTAEDYGCPT